MCPTKECRVLTISSLVLHFRDPLFWLIYIENILVWEEWDRWFGLLVGGLELLLISTFLLKVEVTAYIKFTLRFYNLKLNRSNDYDGMIHLSIHRQCSPRINRKKEAMELRPTHSDQKLALIDEVRQILRLITKYVK